MSSCQTSGLQFKAFLIQEMVAKVNLLAAPQSTAAGNNSPGLGLTFFQMLWAVRCPRIQHLRCQEGWQLPEMPGSGRRKKMAWEFRLSSTSHLWHLTSCMTLKKLPDRPVPSISRGNHCVLGLIQSHVQLLCQAPGRQQSSGDSGSPPLVALSS